MNSPKTSVPQKWSSPSPIHQNSVSSSFKLPNTLNPVNDKFQTEYECKVNDLKHILTQLADEHDCSLEGLEFIDTAQRLGIHYHFETEINAFLKKQYATSVSQAQPPYCSDHNQLHVVALRFRLLREHGYFVSADVFKAFMDNGGRFQKGLKPDIKGLMSLYEASKFCLLHEEFILEEAQNFASHILKISVPSLDGNQAEKVDKTLAYPYHMTMSKFMVRDYFDKIEGFEIRYKWINALQYVAKIDFNTAQGIHNREMLSFSGWWRKTGLANGLQFARNQPLKWYICSMVCLSDPCFSEERIDLTKQISFIYLIDDIFDLYGSLSELSLFTEAVTRWDLTIGQTLPDCMKICLKSLYETTNEISIKILQRHGWNPIKSLKKSWAELCEAFLVEAEWFATGHSPTAQEYLKNGIVSTGLHVVLVHVFFLLGQGICKETVQVLDENPEIISSTATILRLADDLGSAEDENQDGHDGSYIKYYMIENEEASMESTRQHISKLTSFAWKKLNGEYIKPKSLFPKKFTEASLNTARFIPLLYGYDGNQNLPILEKLVTSLLYEKVDV